MEDGVPNRFSDEELRIHEAYRARSGGGRYSWTHPYYSWVMHDVEQRLLRLLRWFPLEQARMLEVGCGSGHWMREFVKWGGEQSLVAGIDLLPVVLRKAKRLSPLGPAFMAASLSNLPFAGAVFDIVAQFTVFTSILDAELRSTAAKEMLRVLKPGGVVIWYDFSIDNPKNTDVRGVSKKEIRGLFPDCRLHLERVTLAPPIGRLVAPRSMFVCRVLDMVVPLRTHYLGLIRKP